MSDTQPTATYITPACIVCRQISTITLPAPIAAALSAGAPVQQLLPKMPRAEREQLISGTHPACWAARFGKDEEGGPTRLAGRSAGRPARGRAPSRSPRSACRTQFSS